MRHFLFFLAFFILFTSCKNKSLQLPQVAVSGISEIKNYSQIWVFYEDKNGEIQANFNRKNTIGTTHWVINIDKRLPISEVIPIFHRIKDKRTDKSIHSIEGMQNYLSYSDIANKKIALFSIDSVQHMMTTSEDIAKIQQDNPCKYILSFSQDAIWLNQHQFTTDKWESFSLDSLSSGNMQLHFDEQLTFQAYMEYRLTLNELLPEDVKIETTEYVIR